MTGGKGESEPEVCRVLVSTAQEHYLEIDKAVREERSSDAELHGAHLMEDANVARKLGCSEKSIHIIEEMADRGYTKLGEHYEKRALEKMVV